MSLFKKNKLTAVILLIAAAGMVFPFIITLPFGPGMGTDGARYLSTAFNLSQGRGFVDFLGNPLTQFPPFYPLLLAIVGIITRLDVFLVSRALNIILFGVSIFLAGTYIRKLFPNNDLFPIAGSLVFATSLSLVRIASNILSDLLFLDLALAFLITAPGTGESLSRGSFINFLMVTLIAPLTRYAGLSFIIAGTLIILLSEIHNGLKKALFSAGIFGVLTSLPILSWTFLHNYIQTGITFGVHTPPNYAGNIQITVSKAAHWFLPYSITDRISPWILLPCLFFLIFLMTDRTDWRRFINNLSSPSFLPSIIFLGTYIPVLIFKASYWELRWPFMDRIHIIILPAILAIGFQIIHDLTPRPLRRLPRRLVETTGVLLFILWLAYPLNNIQKAVRSGYENGEISEYNLYNTRSQNESGLQEYIQGLNLSASDKIFSNYEGMAWFYARNTVHKMPQGTSDQKNPVPAVVLEQFKEWPQDAGYVIWFTNLGFKPYVLSPQDLASIASFDQIYFSKEGEVYWMTPIK